MRQASRSSSGQIIRVKLTHEKHGNLGTEADRRQQERVTTRKLRFPIHRAVFLLQLSHTSDYLLGRNAANSISRSIRSTLHTL
jgi:hypothetical protein